MICHNWARYRASGWAEPILCMPMRLPRDRILEWKEIDRVMAAAQEIASNPEQLQHLEQTFLVRLLLKDERGRLTVEAIDEDAPLLLELGTAVVRPFEEDPSKARLSFRPASPALAAIRRARADGRAPASRARRGQVSEPRPEGH
jgi:hypothetical protein